LIDELVQLQDLLENMVEDIEEGMDEDFNVCCRQTRIHTLKEVLGLINEMG
jgi:Mg2+/Co2+ transporter CorC